jgi:multidrug efflux system membrane fusion protein
MSDVRLSEPETSTPSTTPNRQAPHGAGKLAAVIVLLFLVAAVVIVVMRMSEKKALAVETERLATPSVAVIHPKLQPPEEELVLPASLQAYTESPIYARTNGYVLKWYHDIGSKVNKGDLLADIDTPELDQELLQSRAAREQANAQLQIARVSADRWQALRKTDAVTQQETDERTSALQQGEAALASSTANVRRLEQLESFKHIYAPFAGVITKRNVDVGALINSGNTGTNKELFDIASVNPLRVYIDAPQTYAASIKRGQQANIELQEFPGRKFAGIVARTADAIDPATRTLHTEIDVPNPKGELLPGAFAQVHFAVNIKMPRITVPVNALLFRPEGPMAAVVGADKKVQLKKVTIGRDYGTSLEVLGGVEQSDSLVLNPSDSLESGQEVEVAQTQGSGK